MYRRWMGMGLVAIIALTIGVGLGSALGQPAPSGVDLQVLATVDAGAAFPGYIMRMRRVTFAPGASIPMHGHKDRPEVSIVVDGTLTNTVQGQSPVQVRAGSAIANGPEVVHLPANETSKPVVVISVDLIKK